MNFQPSISLLFGSVFPFLLQIFLIPDLAFTSSSPAAAQDYSPGREKSGWEEAQRRRQQQRDPDYHSGKGDTIGVGPADAPPASSSQTPPRLPRYGAIAYNPDTGQWGRSWGYRELRQANERALRECGQSDCSIVAQVRSGGEKCAALSVSNDRKYKEGLGKSRFDAENRAISNCERLSSWGGCQLLLSVCSDDP